MIVKFLIAHTDSKGCNTAQSQVFADSADDALWVFNTVCPERYATVICQEGETETALELV